MEKKELEKFLLICLGIFSIIPTIFFIADNIMSDAGKGLINMILMYLVGRYLRVYGNKKYSKKKLLLLVIGSVFVTFSLNMLLSFARGTWTNNFSRDCSITIIISSIFIFLLFKELTIQSSTINLLAGNVMAVYIFEGTVRSIINHYFDLENYINCWYLFILVTLYALIVLIICIGVNTVRQFTVGKIEPLLAAFILHWGEWGKSFFKRLCLKRSQSNT